MATNFGSKIAVTGFLWTIATGLLVMEAALSGRPTKCRYCQYTATKGCCHGNYFFSFYIWGAHWRHLVNTTEPSMFGGDVAFCQITLTTCWWLCCISWRLGKWYKIRWNDWEKFTMSCCCGWWKWWWVTNIPFVSNVESPEFIIGGWSKLFVLLFIYLATAVNFL